MSTIEIARTVKDSGAQPFSPFVEIYIAEKQLTFTPPKYVVDLEFSKIKDAGSTFVLSILDEEWDYLEPLFSNNFDNIQIRYGNSLGVQSKTYTCTITDYSVNLNSTGCLLSIKGFSEGVVTNLTPMTLNTKTVNPTEAAKSICRKAGWRVLDENFEPSMDINLSNQDTISLINEYPATYIKNHLAPLAVRKSDGEAGYTFFLDSSTTPPTAYFAARNYTESAIKTYVYMKGMNSPIIDLQLSINGVFGGASFNLVSTELEASFIDPITKENKSLSETVDSVRVTVTGEYSHTKPNQSKAIVDSAGYSPSQMNAILHYKLKTPMPYSGTMVITGDPDFSVGDTIRLIIITKKGNLHHSSGLYFVEGALDKISNGAMTTTLQISRETDIEDGIEITNYRTLLK